MPPAKFGGTMKLRICLAVLMLGLATSSSMAAHDHECTNTTIKGSYSFTVHGQIFTPNGPLVVGGIAKTTFDGNGNLTQVDAVAVNGDLSQVWRPGTGF